MGARRQMRRHARQLCKPIAWTRRRLLLSARRFALRLLRSLFRRGLRLRFGSLRHTALLAIEMAIFGTVQSRIDMHCTPLNEWWTARTSAILAVRTVSELDTRNDPLRSCARITRPEISSAHENPCGTRISRMRADVHPMCPKSWRAYASISRQPAGAVLGGFLAPKKIFAPSRPRAARKRKFRPRAPNRGPIRFPHEPERSP